MSSYTPSPLKCYSPINFYIEQSVLCEPAGVNWRKGVGEPQQQKDSFRTNNSIALIFTQSKLVKISGINIYILLYIGLPLDTTIFSSKLFSMFSYRYASALLPEKGNILTYWIRISKPIFRKMLFPILLQTGFAAYLGSRQYKLLIKALQLPEPGLEIQ